MTDDSTPRRNDAAYWRSAFEGQKHHSARLMEKVSALTVELAECRQQLSEVRYTISQLQQGKEG